MVKEYLFNLIKKHDKYHSNHNDEILSIVSKNRHLLFSSNIEEVEENFGFIRIKKINLLSYVRYLQKEDIHDSLIKFRNQPLRRKRSLSREKFKKRSRSRDCK